VSALLVGPHKATRLIAGLRPAGIAYSDNSGASWRAAALPAGGAGAVTRLLLTGGEAGNLYAIATDTVLMSQDGGHSWQPMSELTVPIVDLAAHPDAPGTLYAGGPDGLFRTRNGGRAWQRLAGQPMTALLVHPNRPRTIIAARPDGLAHSSNAGASWHPMPGGQADPDDPVRDLIGHAVGDVVLALTLDGRILELVDGQWQPPAMGPTPPVLTAVATSGDLAQLSGMPKRGQTRRRRPARRDDSAQRTTAARPAAPSSP
jgi:hypothetical protein